VHLGNYVNHRRCVPNDLAWSNTGAQGRAAEEGIRGWLFRGGGSRRGPLKQGNSSSSLVLPFFCLPELVWGARSNWQPLDQRTCLSPVLITLHWVRDLEAPQKAAGGFLGPCTWSGTDTDCPWRRDRLESCLSGGSFCVSSLPPGIFQWLIQHRIAAVVSWS